MRRYTIYIILIISFILNGCLVDRIKQRIYAREYTKQTINRDFNSNKNIKVEESFSDAPKEEYIITTSIPTRSYTPTVTTKEKRVVKKRIKKKKIVKKRIKKRKVVKKRVKRYKKVKKKISHEEPFSIKKDETDPELLGPQTTLKENPLTSKTN